MKYRRDDNSNRRACNQAEGKLYNPLNRLLIIREAIVKPFNVFVKLFNVAAKALNVAAKALKIAAEMVKLAIKLAVYALNSVKDISKGWLWRYRLSHFCNNLGLCYYS
jgi:hypothetical protein